MKLKSKTKPEWINVVLSSFDAFLQDHAACEKKASATALSLVAHYPDKRELVQAMIGLAKEELDHFREVYAILDARQMTLGSDEKDPYISALKPWIRNAKAVYLMDRLIMGGIIEARGSERFAILSQHAPEPSLKEFYGELVRSEGRHSGLFFSLAYRYFPRDEVERRIEDGLQFEASVIETLPMRAALH